MDFLRWRYLFINTLPVSHFNAAIVDQKLWFDSKARNSQITLMTVMLHNRQVFTMKRNVLGLNYIPALKQALKREMKRPSYAYIDFPL